MDENPTTDSAQETAPGPQDEARDRAHDGGPRVTAEQVRDLGAVRRSTTDRHVAGVAGGLARHLDVDPIILRVGFVVLSFFGGAGLIIYLACWLLVPEDDGSEAVFNLDARSRNVALVGVGVLAALALVGDAWGGGWFAWPLIVVGLVAWLFLARKERRGQLHDEPSGEGYGAAAPPTSSAPSARRRPRDPRKRGPILFWFTLALTAVALGVLGIVDLAGVGITDSAYPALALGVVAVMLLVGAFWGRAGGLILLGLVAALVLSGTTLAERFEGTRIDETPTSAAELQSTYDIDAGEIKLDLTRIRDLDELDGRTLDLRVEFGRVEVIVPRELHVSATGEIEVGDLTVFRSNSGGFDLSASSTNPGDTDEPHLHIDTDVEVGEIDVVAR